MKEDCKYSNNKSKSSIRFVKENTSVKSFNIEENNINDITLVYEGHKSKRCNSFGVNTMAEQTVRVAVKEKGSRVCVAKEVYKTEYSLLTL